MALVACGSPHATTGSLSPTITSGVQATPEGTALACRLPVAGFVPSSPKGSPDNSVGPDGQPNQKGTGGFLDVPSGKYTTATDSDRSYVAAAHAWLPVPPQAISPDERSYVEGKAHSVSASPPTTTLYLVDIKTKTERLLYTAPEGDMAIVLAYTAAGVFVETLSSTGPGPSDVVLIDPATGSHQPVPGAQAKPGVYEQDWMAISDGAAWGFAITFPNGQSAPYLVTLERLDLGAGSETAWYTSQIPFTVIGFDGAGHPILATLPLAQGGTKLSLVSAPDKSVVLQPLGGTYMEGRGQGLRDVHGTWFGSADGSIWLYTPAGTFERVASVPPQAGATGAAYDPHAWRSIAGPCV
jgi:hypothetical protein